MMDLSELSKPGGWLIKTSSSSVPFKKALLLSSWFCCQPLESERVNIVMTITWVENWWKSLGVIITMPLMKTLRLIKPYIFKYIDIKVSLYPKYLQPIGVLPERRWTNNHVAFFNIELYSSSIAEPSWVWQGMIEVRYWSHIRWVSRSGCWIDSGYT